MGFVWLCFFGVLGNFCLGLGFGVVYGLPRSLCSLAMTAGDFREFVILSVAKNPLFKYANSRFKFMDTSLTLSMTRTLSKTKDS